MKKGLAILPQWYSVLRMAENWRIPAWEIDKRTPALFWYLRAEFVWNEKARLQKEQYDESRKSWPKH